MNRAIFFTVLIFIPFLLISQGINQKSIVVNNKDNANYVDVPGVPIRFIPPKGFVKSDSFFGYTHKLAGSSIVISDLRADVNRSFLSFSKNELFKTGVLVSSETMYRINGFDAMLVKGQQNAHGNIYNRIILVVGNHQRTVLLNASYLSSSSESHGKQIKESLLSVIFNPNQKVNPIDRFDFSVNVEGTILKPGDMMLNSLMFTDDGHVPSRSENPVSLMVRKTKSLLPLSEDDKITLCKRLFDLYPVEWSRTDGMTPRKIKINGLVAYEMFGIGNNREALKPELIYQVVVFDKDFYYVITGISNDRFSENLRMFRKVARTLEN